MTETGSLNHLGYRDRSGRSVSRDAWERLVTDEGYCLIALDPVSEAGVVETRWTGIYDGAIDELPYVFTTGLQWRGPWGSELQPDTLVLACSETEARANHVALLQRLDATVKCSRRTNF